MRQAIPFTEWRDRYLVNDDCVCPLDEWHAWPGEPEYEAIPHILNHGAQYAGLGIYLDYQTRYLPPTEQERIQQRQRGERYAATLRAKAQQRERNRQTRERQEQERRQRVWQEYQKPVCPTPQPSALYANAPSFTPSHTFTVDKATIHAIQNRAQSTLGTKACGQCWRVGLVAIIPDGDVGWNPDQRLWLLTSVCSGCGTRAVFAWSDTIAPARR